MWAFVRVSMCRMWSTRKHWSKVISCIENVCALCVDNLIQCVHRYGAFMYSWMGAPIRTLHVPF